MTPRLLIFCNAFDDRSRLERRITTDSPAGSRKVFLLAYALRKSGVRPWVLSLGRGRVGGGGAVFFPVCVRRIEGVPVVYAAFSTIPFLSEVISLVAFVPLIFRMKKCSAKGTLFYNRMLAYVPALVLSSCLGYRQFLDLEDGEVSDKMSLPQQIMARALASIYDRLCSGGALLACMALRAWTSIRPTLCYYGTAVGDDSPRRFSAEMLTILMSGALLPETGAELLADAIDRLRAAELPCASALQFEVTGKGESLERFRLLEQTSGYPAVRVHGRTTDVEYREILSRCDIGLALKLNAGSLAHTTFPSKVVEFAAAGLLVLTTDISDVRAVLGDQGALFLQSDDPDLLNSLLFEAQQNRERCQAIAWNGLMRVREQCDPTVAGAAVSRFMFESRA